MDDSETTICILCGEIAIDGHCCEIIRHAQIAASQTSDQMSVHHRQVVRMADRLWRLGSPARRAAYVEKARRRIAEGHARTSDVAILLAADPTGTQPK